MNVTTKQMSDVIRTIQAMDSEQVSSLVDSIKLRRTKIAREAAGSFNVGDTVQFKGRTHTMRGTVLKIAIKNVTVQTTEGRWKVPASMLSASDVVLA